MLRSAQEPTNAPVGLHRLPTAYAPVTVLKSAASLVRSSTRLMLSLSNLSLSHQRGRRVDLSCGRLRRRAGNFCAHRGGQKAFFADPNRLP